MNVLRRLLEERPDLVSLAKADWKRANDLFEHPRCCRCSTCELTASLGAVVRAQEAKR